MNKKYKVILYNPQAIFFDMPLALLSIGSFLDSKKYDVIIIDGRLEKEPFAKIQENLKDAICFGVTVITGSPINDALKISRQVKKYCHDLPIIWGGWHTSLFPKAPLEDEDCIDVTVQGQGEVTFSELVEAISVNGDFKNIKGITYRNEQGQIIQNPGRILEDINLFPSVNYELINIEAYFKAKGHRQLDYISSTGCNFRCTFCSDPFVYNRKWTGKKPEKIVEEIKYWKKKYKITDVNFQDETFFTNPQRINKMARLFLESELNITWAATMRADQGHRMSDDDFALCAKSGLRRVLIGVESGSQEMMDWLKKDIKLEYVLECAERCKKYNISVIFPFIVGFPGETSESIDATIKLVKKLNSMHKNFTTPIFYFKPYPGSALTYDVINNGYQLPDSTQEWAKFDYIGSSGPWVSQEKYNLIENFKFYNSLAWNSKHILLAPFRHIARFRCKNDFYKIPWEKLMIEKIKPKQRLS